MAGILLNRSRQVPAEETPAFGGIAERFRRAGDLDRAIALCRDGLQRFPEQLSARVTLGWSLLDKGQYDAARDELEQVLRKAPDNLAAIRGLAELHDRTEGALAAEDERSWTSNAAAADTAAAASAASAAEAAAPIQVTPSAGDVVHTADHAAEAAGSAAPPMEGLITGPVELEDAAAASMAASDPAPFFVGDPAESRDAAPGRPAVAFETVEIETPGQAALAATDDVASFEVGAARSSSVEPFEDGDVDLAALAETAFQVDAAGEAVANAQDAGTDLVEGEPVSVPSQDDDMDWAGLGDLTGDALLETPSEPAGHVDVLSPVASTHADADLSIEPLFEDALDGEAALEADIVETPDAVITAPEGFDDIDELAGQDLAEAIRALEDAARRVEARLAPQQIRNEPAASAEDINAFDFGAAASDADLAEAGQADSTVVHTGQDGAFELVAPDLADLAFVDADTTPQADADMAASSAESDAAAEAAEAAQAFDFDRVEAVAVDETGVEPSVPDATEGGPAPLAGVETGFEFPDGAVSAVEHLEGPADGSSDQAAALLTDDTGLTDDRPAMDEAATVVDAEAAKASDVDAPGAEMALAGEATGIETGDVNPLDQQETADVLDADSGRVVDALAEDMTAESGVVETVEGPDAREFVEHGAQVAAVESESPAPEPEAVSIGSTGDVAAPGAVNLSSIESAEGAEPPAVGEADVEEVGLTSEPGESSAPFDVSQGAGDASEDAAADTDAPPLDSDRDRSGDLEDLAQAALAETAPLVEPNGTQDAGVSTGMDVAPPIEPAAESEPPVRHVYDAPVFVAASRARIAAEVAALAAAEVADVAAPAAMVAGQVQIETAPSPLKALERFLRKVQARQLELRGETVA